MPPTVTYMNNQKKIVLGSFALALAVAAILGTSHISQAAGTKGASDSGRGARHMMKMDSAKQAEMQTKHLAVEKAVEAGDYNAWLEAIGDNSPLKGKITAANFSKLTQIHQLEKQQEALRAELGIENLGHFGKGPLK